MTPSPAKPPKDVVDLTVVDQPIVVDMDNDAMYNEATKLPDEIAALIPPLTASILDLLSINDLPDRCNGSSKFPQPESCLVHDRIDWTPQRLLNAAIPPATWIRHLQQEVKQRIAAGATPTAVRHPVVHGLVLPLWGVAFWFGMSYALEQYNVWYSASETLEDWSAEGIDDSEAKALMGQVTWGAIVRCLNEYSPIGFLAELLHPTAWLRERHLDLFASYLAHRAEGRATKDVWIKGVYPAHLLISKGGNAPGLKGYATEITEGSYNHILIPAHVNGNHWVVLSADIKKAKVRWGESPNASGSGDHLLTTD